ncbi:diguanylate cyclase [Bacillus sp. B15-48]|nr:diguanylate cyclase [Bacillus sp. B15-48]
MTTIMEEQSSIGHGLYELIWENTNDAIFLIGKDGEILHANPTFTEILGWTIEDIQGVTPPPFFFDMSKEQHENFLNKLKSGKNIIDCVTKRRSKGGVVQEILATYRAVNHGEILAVGMYKDFTEQMELQRKLKESEVCYRNLVEGLPDAIIVLNKHHIVFANPAGVAFLGQEDVHPLIGRPLSKFISSEEKESLQTRLAKMIGMNNHGAATRIVGKIVRYDEKVFCVEITAIPIMYNGESMIQIQFRDIEDRKEYELKLENLAFHDPLTGLKNRRGFYDILNKTMESALQTGEILAFMYLDLDKFKEINDTYGHDSGDELLKLFANRLQNNLRKDSVVGRIGGDEFLVLLPSIENTQNVIRIIERLHNVLQQPYLVNESFIGITALKNVEVHTIFINKKMKWFLYLGKTRGSYRTSIELKGYSQKTSSFFKGEGVFLYHNHFSAQASTVFNDLPSSVPFLLNEYSVLTGRSVMTFLMTIPQSSSSFIRSFNTRLLKSGIKA